MKVTYKYNLPVAEVSKVSMPRHSRIIRVDGLDGGLWLWAIVDTEEPMETREFHLFKTGGEMPDNIGEYCYVGCGAIFIQMELMLYVYEAHWKRAEAEPAQGKMSLAEHLKDFTKPVFHDTGPR